MAKSLIGAAGLGGFGGLTQLTGIGQCSFTFTSGATLQTVVDRSAAIRGLRFYISLNTLASTTVLSLRKNGVNAISVNVLAGQLGWFGSSSQINVKPGDRLDIHLKGGVGGGILVRSAIAEMEEIGAGAHTYFGRYGDGVEPVDVLDAPNQTKFIPICGLRGFGATDDSSLANQWARAGIAVEGTLRRLRVSVESNTRATPTLVKTRIDGADGNCTITIPALASGEFEDLVNSDETEIETTIGYKTQTGSGSGSLSLRTITCLFESPVNQIPIVSARAGSNVMAVAAGETVSLRVMGSIRRESLSTEQNTAFRMPYATTAFRMQIHVAQVSGSPLIFRTRVNGANGNQSVVVMPGATGTFGSLASDILNADDLFNYACEAPSVPSTWNISWASMVLGEPPVVPPPPPPPPDPGTPCDNPTFLPDPCDPTPVFLDLLWPFVPNWADPFEITRAFRTEIITSRSGREQRRAARQEGRRTVALQNVLHGDTRRKYDMLMALNQFGRFTVPNWSRHLTLTEELAAGEARAAYEELEEPEWFFPGEPVVLAYGHQTGLRYAAGIDTSGVLDFEDYDDITWPVGTKVYPGLFAFHQPQVSTTRITNDVTTGRFTFEVDPGANVVETVGEPDQMFNDREIFLFKPNWASGISASDAWPVDVFDVGVGRLYRHRTVTHRENTTQLAFVRRGLEEADAIDRFFMRHYGRAREFYAPTHAHDIPINAGWLDTATTLAVDGEEFAEAYGEDPTRRALSVLLRDGTRINRTIAAISVGVGISIIALDDPMSAAVSLDEIVMISWLNVCRFSSDELTMRWITDGVADCRVSLVSLEQLPPEIEQTDSNTGL